MCVSSVSFIQELFISVNSLYCYFSPVFHQNNWSVSGKSKLEEFCGNVLLAVRIISEPEMGIGGASDYVV